MHLLLTTALLLAPAETPPPVVTPIPVVRAPARDYTACLAAVDAGRTVHLAVGVAAETGDYSTPSLEGVAPGRYKCWSDAGTPVMQPAAQEVRPASTFPAVRGVLPLGGGLSDGRVTVAASAVADHHCPNCRTGPYTMITGWNNNGTHNHLCTNCGLTFSH